MSRQAWCPKTRSMWSKASQTHKQSHSQPRAICQWSRAQSPRKAPLAFLRVSKSAHPSHLRQFWALTWMDKKLLATQVNRVRSAPTQRDSRRMMSLQSQEAVPFKSIASSIHNANFYSKNCRTSQINTMRPHLRHHQSQQAQSSAIKILEAT